MSESDGERQHDGQQPQAGAAAGNDGDAAGNDGVKAQLRTELKATLAELAGLQVEIERLASCKHSRESAQERVCGECGAEVW
jgi:hypothetical protein